MAVKDDGAVYFKDTIIAKQGRKHYRVPVRSQHWQLRSLISAENQNVVYFPGGTNSHHIQRLDTSTTECETIKLLAFAPRCLVAKYGWLCCGSENGDFVAIRLNPEPDIRDFPLDLDPTARLPLGLDFSREHEESLMTLVTRARTADKSLVAKSSKMAKDRVNCVTLWAPSPTVPTCDGAYSGPVAVLANNDRTVTLVILEEFDAEDKTEPSTTITYPDFVNRAIISPDGRFLVAVLDDPYLYVHERVPKSSVASIFKTPLDFHWVLRQRVMLKSQRKDDKTDSRGSFAASFSSSGAYLAIGTQHGSISIFDASLLGDSKSDPLITTFPSSQPGIPAGAVRDMAFCPGPYDVLAWTEDRGHVGMADMRNNFMGRQVVDITVEDDYEHINVLDRNTIDPRLTERQYEGLLELQIAGRAQQHGAARGVERLDAVNQPLNTDETLVLEAIRQDRQRRARERQNAADTPARSSSMSRALIGRSGEEAAPSPPRERLGSQAVAELLRDYRERSSRTPRELVQDRVLRRHALLDASARQQTSRRADQRWMDRLAETMETVRDVARERQNRQDASYLTVLEILQARERNSTSQLAENEDSSIFTAVRPNPVAAWEESAVRGTLPVADRGIFDSPPTPDNTAGLSWSEDGRTLFVGAQNGIYELRVNVQSRKYSPGITFR